MEHLMTKEEIRRKFKTNFTKGLTEDEAKERLKIYGKNKLKEKKKENIIVKFLKQFNDFMIIILIVASIISAIIFPVYFNPVMLPFPVLFVLKVFGFNFVSDESILLLLLLSS